MYGSMASKLAIE